MDDIVKDRAFPMTKAIITGPSNSMKSHIRALSFRISSCSNEKHIGRTHIGKSPKLYNIPSTTHTVALQAACIDGNNSEARKSITCEAGGSVGIGNIGLFSTSTNFGGGFSTPKVSHLPF